MNIFLKATLAICFFILPNVALAQYQSYFAEPDDGYPSTFSGGYVVGANISQVDGDNISGYNKLGLNVGGAVYARFTSQFGMSFELLFSQKGTRSRAIRDGMAGPGVQEYDIKLNYIELPVAVRIFTKKRVHFGFGASYSRLIGFKEEAFANGPINLNPDVNYFRKNDFCVLGEVAYEFYKGSFLAFRLHRSFISIRDAERIPQGYGGGESPGQYNNYVSLRLIHLFN